MASSCSSGSSSSPLALETPASSISGQRDLSVEIKAESPPDTTLFQGTGKPKKKRKGRVIGVLREQLSKSVVVHASSSPPPPLHIAPSSASSRLATTELTAALAVHLVGMASGEILAFSKPRLLDLSATVSQVRGRAIRRENVNGYQEVLLACLAALGARHSNHTGIVGGPTPGSLSNLEVGMRREAACQTLTQHAINIATESKLLDEVSPRALEAANLLRATIFALAPQHPFAANLVQYGHRNFFDIKSFASFDESTLNSYSIFSLVVYDAITAVAQERSLQISDSELKTLGWDTDPFIAASAFDTFPPDPDYRDNVKKLHRVRAGATVLRALAQHQSLGVLPDPADILPAFRQLWALSDEHLSSVFALGPGFEQYGGKVDLSFLTVPMFVEAVVAKLAARQCRERGEEEGREVLGLAQERYLKCLKMFIYLLQPLSPSVDLHNRALLLNSLEQLPGWLELSLEGAVHFEKGQGVLSSAGFGFDDLRRLLRLLENVGAISARSEAYRVDLEQAMVALGVPTITEPTEGATAALVVDGLPYLPSPPKFPGAGADRLAVGIVENALEEIIGA